MALGLLLWNLSSNFFPLGTPFVLRCEINMAAEPQKSSPPWGKHCQASCIGKLHPESSSRKIGMVFKTGNVFHSVAGTLEMHEADLLNPGAFDNIFKGCHFVFHTASPFYINAEDPYKELVETAVKGTENVMMAAAKAMPHGLKRIVLTSSCAAIKGFKGARKPSSGHLYSEQDWNTTSTVENGEAYWLGKTEAEKLAWKLAEEYHLDLVTILPEFIMGPVLSPASNATSVNYFKSWLEGKVQDGAPVFADVRDVAKAHILAAENPRAKGRYIVANDTSTPPSMISSWLKERFPEYYFETVEHVVHSEQVIDNSRVKNELGLNITPVKQTLIDMAVTMIVLNLALPRLETVT